MMNARACRAGGVALALLFAAAASAEEGGSGHYMPGSIASFMDGVAPVETFLIRYNLVYYDGSVSPRVRLPIAGEATLGANATLWGQGITLFWRPPVEIGGNWSYGMSATIPYVSLDVRADVVAGAGTIRRSDSVGSLGDIVLMPLMFNYQVSEDVNWNFRLSAIAPTGDYEVGRLANTGKNFWTLEPAVGFMYFGKKNGRELSVFLGADFNEENPDTDYKSGTQAHIEFTAAQHFPFSAGLAGIGLTGFWYEQVTGDSGAGAAFGDFEARTIGAGPVVSLIGKAGGHDLLAELKWLHEFETRNRLQGDIVFLKVIYKFY
jgi:hypothetical protein